MYNYVYNYIMPLLFCSQVGCIISHLLWRLPSTPAAQIKRAFRGGGALSGFAVHGITVNAAPFLLTSGVHHQPPFVASSKFPHLLPLAGVLTKQNVPCVAWHSTGHEKAGSI